MPYSSNELQIPEVDIISKTEIDGRWVYDVAVKPTSPECTVCGSLQVSRNGYKTRSLKDSPLYEKEVELNVKCPKYKCTRCAALFVLPLSFAGKSEKTTTRLRKQIEAKCLRENTAAIAEQYYVSPATVNTITQDYIQRCEKNWIPYTPNVLALRKIVIGQKNYMLCIDAERAGIVDLLPYSTKDTLQTALEERFSFIDVEYCVVEMDRVILDAVRAAAKKETIITIDNNAVIIRVVTACKKDLKGTDHSIIRELFKNRFTPYSNREIIENAAEVNPKVKIIDDLLESLYSTYFQMGVVDGVIEPEADNVDVFLDKMANISENHSKELPALSGLCGLVSYFTNEIAEIEAFIGKTGIAIEEVFDAAIRFVRSVQRKGSGYSFQTLRARILFGQPFKLAVKSTTSRSKAPKGILLEKMAGFDYDETLGTYAPIEMLLANWLDEEDYSYQNLVVKTKCL